MTLKYFAGLLITGTNTDRTGGTWTNLPVGWRFLETDTQVIYYWTGTDWVPQSYMSTPDVIKTGAWTGPNIASGDGILNGRLIQITVGAGPPTASLASDSSGIYYSHDTSATTNNITGQRCSVAVMRRVLNAYFKAKIRTDTSIANVRIYCGFISSQSNPASAADPLANLSGVGLWYDSAVSANWKRGHNDGDATGDYDDTSVVVATSTEYIVEIYAHADNKFRFVFNGTSTDISTEIPASTTGLAYWIYIENTTGASRIMRHYYTTVRNDK